jgi:hypothetical protein
MNKIILSILVCFIFIFPVKVFSKTFKCEFVQEKFDGGQSNEATCSGTGEIAMGLKRTEHCKVDFPVFSFSDYIDFNVDLNQKTIAYTAVRGVTDYGIKHMILDHKKKGDKTEEEVRKDYSKVYKRKQEGFNILSINTYQSSPVLFGKEPLMTNYLIVYKDSYLDSKRPDEHLYSLFIPNNGHSIITEYNSSRTRKGESSWVNVKFGKCIQMN